MSDFIRRDDVIKAIHGYWGSKINELPTENTEDGEIITDVHKANEYLEHNKQLSLFIQLIEAVEVVEPKCERWIVAEDIGDCCYRCSNCGFIRDAYVLDVGKYCPNCGAKMEKDDE